MGLGSGGRQWNTSHMKTEIVMDGGGGISWGQEDERQESTRRRDTKFCLKML